VITVCEEVLDNPARSDNGAMCARFAGLKAIGSVGQSMSLFLESEQVLALQCFGRTEIISRSSGFGGEVFHVYIGTDGQQCSYGERRCWERYCCARSLRSDLNAAGYLDFPRASVFADRDENPFLGNQQKSRIFVRGR